MELARLRQTVRGEHKGGCWGLGMSCLDLGTMWKVMVYGRGRALLPGQVQVDHQLRSGSSRLGCFG